MRFVTPKCSMLCTTQRTNLSKWESVKLHIYYRLIGTFWPTVYFNNPIKDIPVCNVLYGKPAQGSLFLQKKNILMRLLSMSRCMSSHHSHAPPGIFGRANPNIGRTPEQTQSGKVTLFILWSTTPSILFCRWRERILNRREVKFFLVARRFAIS